MKHLIAYNEAQKYTKDMYNISDILLIFKDSGKLEDYLVNGELDRSILIHLLVDEQLDGFEKLKVISDIVDRLKKKYTYTRIAEFSYGSQIAIDLVNKGVDYINYNLFDVANNMLDENLSNLKVFKANTYIYYGKSENDLMLEYDMKTKFVHVREKIYKYLIKLPMLDSGDADKILKEYLTKKLNIEIKFITHGLITDKTYALKCLK